MLFFLKYFQLSGNSMSVFESDVTYEKSATSLYPKKILLANNYLDKWESFYKTINEEEYFDRYLVSKIIESYLIPAIADIAFALESMISFWIHFVHPLYKVELSSVDKKNRPIDFESKPAISSIVFDGIMNPSFSEKLEALLVCCFNNYMSPRNAYKKINDIPVFCYPIHSDSFNALTLHTTLSYIYKIRSDIVHSSPLYDYTSILKNPLDHIIQVQNVIYIDKLTNKEFIIRTNDALHSLKYAIDCFNHLAEILRDLHTLFDIPNIRSYDPISANYRFASKKMQLQFNTTPNMRAFKEKLGNMISYNPQLNIKLTNLKFKQKFFPNHILNYGGDDYLYMQSISPLGKTILYMRDTLPINFKETIGFITHIYPLDDLEEIYVKRYKHCPKIIRIKKSPKKGAI